MTLKDSRLRNNSKTDVDFEKFSEIIRKNVTWAFNWGSVKHYLHGSFNTNERSSNILPENLTFEQKELDLIFLVMFWEKRDPNERK